MHSGTHGSFPLGKLNSQSFLTTSSYSPVTEPSLREEQAAPRRTIGQFQEHVPSVLVPSCGGDGHTAGWWLVPKQRPVDVSKRCDRTSSLLRSWDWCIDSQYFSTEIPGPIPDIHISMTQLLSFAKEDSQYS